MPIRILFRCDDAGSSRGANTAIHQAIASGVCRNTSVMVPGPHFAEVKAAFDDIAHLADFGLHLTLNSEWEQHGEQAPARWGPVLPATAVPSIVLPDGTFKRFPMENHESHASLDEMVAEAAAQLDAALAAGLPIAYMDEHMGCGWLPGLRDRLRAVAHARGVPYADDARLEGLPPIENEPGDPWAVLARRILAAPDGDYIHVTHPALNDAEGRGMCMKDLPPGRVAGERDLDRRTLCHPEVFAALRERGVELLRYSDVLPKVEVATL